jgi:hypothetical protein
MTLIGRLAAANTIRRAAPGSTQQGKSAWPTPARRSSHLYGLLFMNALKPK